MRHSPLGPIEAAIDKRGTIDNGKLIMHIASSIDQINVNTLFFPSQTQHRTYVLSVLKGMPYDSCNLFASAPLPAAC